jgi:hypothetical protein
VKQTEQTQLDQKYDLDQWKYNRKQQHNPTDEQVAMGNQIESPHEQARLISMAKPFDFQDRHQDGGPIEKERAECCRSRTTQGNRATGKSGDPGTTTGAASRLTFYKRRDSMNQTTTMARFEMMHGKG